MSGSGEEKKGFDFFELLVAMLLGAGAVGGAWTAWQGDLWGASATETYGEAGTIATKAGTVFNHGMTIITRDAAVDIRAKELVLEGLTTKDPLVKERTFLMAKYLYTQQIGDEAYAALGYPAEFRTSDTVKAASLPDAALIAGLEKDLDAAYLDKVLAAGKGAFEDSEKKFASARSANESGDRFGLDGVLFMIALFLAGISLVFKSGVRWVFFIMGVFVFGAATSYLFLLEWAEFQWPWG